MTSDSLDAHIRQSSGPDVLVLAPDLARGGVSRHSEHVCRAAISRGMSVRLVTVVATGEPHDLPPDTVVGVPDIEDVPALLRSAGTVLVQASPSTLPFLTLLAGAGPAVLAVHGSPGTNLPWWGSGAAQFLHCYEPPAAVPQILVPGAAYREGVALELGLPLAAVSVGENVTVVEPGHRRPAGCRSVTVPMRLSLDKAWVLDSAVELARAGGVPLRLVGHGAAAGGLEARLRQADVVFEVVHSEDVLSAMDDADVVVGVGLVALEAAARGRRVAVAHKDHPGRFAGVVTPATWHVLRAGNFAGVGGASMAVSETWRRLAELDGLVLADTVQVVERAANPDRLLEAVLAAARPLGPARTDEAVSALLSVHARQALELKQFDGWVAQLQRSADAAVEHSRRLQSELSELQADHARALGAAAALADEASAQRERAVEALAEQEAARRAVEAELHRSRAAAAAAQASADDLWNQLSAVLSSTAWRVSAPVRILGHVRRRGLRLSPLAGSVTRRRAQAAVRLAARGDWQTVAQRLRALRAVHAAGREVGSGTGRELARTPAVPWPEQEPLVTVVIPCFNYGAYVDDAVHSVLRQTVADRLEIIVVDGGSTDEGTTVRMDELACCPPPRTTVLLRRDGRHLVGDNRNFGIARARGRYVCCLDADDMLEPVYLEVALYLLERWGYDLVSTATRCFDLSDERFGLLPVPTLEDMLLANNVTTAAVFRRDLWQAAGGYHDAGLGNDYVYEDWKLWVRMAAIGARIANIVGEPLLRYRVHAVSSLSRQSGSVVEMARHRDAVRLYNADLVTPEAVEASRRRAHVDVLVEDGRTNLVPSRRDPRPTVLLAMPFLCIGGAERLLSTVVQHLVASSGFRVVITTDVYTDPAFGDATEWFTPATQEIYHLHRLLSPHQWGDFVEYLVDAKAVDVVLVAGSAHTYSLLRRLRDRNPRLAVVDLLFNTVGHTENNRRHAADIDVHLCEQLEVQEWLLAAGEAPDRVVRVPSGIDTTQYRPVAGGAREVLKVGYSGRLSEEKDPLAFLDIAHACRSEHFHFVMTGAGPLEGKLRQRLRGVPETRLRFLGVVPDVRAHLADLDVLIVPSRLDGRPMVVLEALALGVPVIASDVGGLPELIEDGVNGFVVPAGDVEAFASALRRLAADPELLLRLKAAARQSAEQRLDAQAMYRAYEEVLRRATEARCSSSHADGRALQQSP